MNERQTQERSRSDALDIAFLQGVIDSNPDAIVVIDDQNRLLLYNQNYQNLWGSPSPSMGEMSQQARWAHQASMLRDTLGQHALFPMPYVQGEQQNRRQVFRMTSGRWYERHTYDHLVRGHKVGLVIHWRDVTAVHEANRKAEYERELMHALMDSIPDQIFFKDRHSRFLRINPSLAKRYGLSDPEQAVGKSDADFYDAEHAAKTLADEQSIMQTGEPMVGVVDLELWPNGTTSWNVSTKMPLFNPSGKLIGTYGIAHDITEHKKAETLIWQQANFDALTGLPNRRLLRDRWEQASKAQQRSGLGLALLLLDLDHFKEVNDSLGHATGDALLIQAAQRIATCLRASDTVARMGGDEFAIILADLHDAGMAGDIAQKVVHALAEPFALGGEQAYVTASIGIALSPDDGTDLDALFQHADQAMYLTKSRGRNGFRFFTPELQDVSQTRLRLVNDLRQALPQNQLYLAYQPIVDLASGRVVKAEALLRWEHPRQGLVPPATFIPLAESSGLIQEVGEWVFRQAAQQVQQWRTTLCTDLQITVNKSPVQFQHPQTSPLLWRAHLQSLGLDGHAMVVEITESLLLDGSEQVQRQLLDMRSSGLQVALDDFGTGYSALAYLQRYEIDFIKIDQSFVRGLQPQSKNLALCKAIIQMAHELGMRVVAEGIETTEQRDLLIAAGCDFGQGYLFARPLCTEDFEAYLRLRNG